MNRKVAICKLAFCLIGVFQNDSALSEDHEVSGKNVAELLISPVPDFEIKGKRILEAHSDELIDEALAELKHEDFSVVARGARKIRVFLSPWSQGIERSRLHHGKIELGYPGRPTERPVDHPRATECADALLDAMDRSLRAINTKVTEENHKGHYAARTAFGSICSSLGEIADKATLDKLAVLLEGSSDPNFHANVISIFEVHYALPVGFRQSFLCGLSSPEEFKKHAKEEEAGSREGARKVLDWHQRFRDEPADVRLNASLDQEWSALFKKQSFIYKSCYNSGWAWNKLTPLIRPGNSLIPLVKQRIAKEDDTGVKANYAVILATITGEIDDDLIRQLLASENPGYKNHYAQLACEIIVAAQSKDWLKELDSLQYRPYFKQRKASHALAICHRKEAIPFLKKAQETNPSNSTARYAIEELESWDG